MWNIPTAYPCLRDTAVNLSGRIAELGPFELLSNGSMIPVFSFRLKDASRYSVYDVSEHLRTRGWQVPAYTMLPDAGGTGVEAGTGYGQTGRPSQLGSL